ncbi:MAG: hypothetical protein WCG86_03105 [Actinomycetota bacterium]
MRLIVRLFKFLPILALAGVAAGLTSLLRRSKHEGRPISYDQWPDVPRKPETLA